MVPAPTSVPLPFAAAGEGAAVTAYFNGRIAEPRCFERTLDPGELARVAAGGDLGDLRRSLWGAWDFGPTPRSTLARDHGGHHRDGVAVNNPARALRGPRWDGTVSRPADAPGHYDAAHFHDDDLSDAGWKTTATYEVPPDLPSGVYAARLRSADEQDYLPFVVRPGRDADRRARALFVLPTLTYLAYANEHYYDCPLIDWNSASDRPLRLDASDHRIRWHPEFGHSLYDLHSDGTYTMYSSRLRPILHLRPKIVSYCNAAGRHFCADLYLLGWLHHEDIPVDVVTDEGVPRFDGAKLLYRTTSDHRQPPGDAPGPCSTRCRVVGVGGRLMTLAATVSLGSTTIAVRVAVVEVSHTRPRPAPSRLMGAARRVSPQPRRPSSRCWRIRCRGPETWLVTGCSASPGVLTRQSYSSTPARLLPRTFGDLRGGGGRGVRRRRTRSGRSGRRRDGLHPRAGHPAPHGGPRLLAEPPRGVPSGGT